jgi:ketosteroid isomerase-like protein
MCPGPMIFEVHDLAIEAGDNIAFGHYLVRCGTVAEDGKEDAGYMRVTFCCRRTSGKWKIAHEHFSAPFDPESGKALLRLEP